MSHTSHLRTLHHLLIAAGISLVALPAFAQYTGPGPAPLTVAQILKNPQDDQFVTLQGHIVQRQGNERYLFSDGTGQIQLEIDQKYFPAQNIDEKTRVEISGEVEKDFFEALEIDVKSVKIIADH